MKIIASSENYKNNVKTVRAQVVNNHGRYKNEGVKPISIFEIDIKNRNRNNNSRNSEYW